MRCTDAAPIEAALEHGITLFDTARAYGENEALVAKALAGRDVRVITKGGMRPGWIPDGRARSIEADFEASLATLGRIDLYLVHAPDPAVPWTTTVRALSRLKTRVGLSNVSRKQLDEALDIAPIAAVEVALGAKHDEPLRNGVVRRCIDLGIDVIAHSPFGGPKHAPKLAKDAVLAKIAAKHGTNAYAIVLAALVDLHPRIVPIPGASRPESVRAWKAIELDDEDRAALEKRFGWRAMLEPPPRRKVESPAEVVLLMGLQGAGKSTRAAEYDGYERLNRDASGGTMRGLHAALDERLARGAKKIVLDNTYTTRAQRQGAIAAARRHGAIVRGVWLEVPLEDAQINVIRRMLAAHGRLLEPAEMLRAKDPSALPPTALLRTLRDLERPAMDEGFDALESVPFVRTPIGTHAARFVAIEALAIDPSLGEGACVFGWQSKAPHDCAHPDGPPRCWCRPPLPGLLLRFAIDRDVDLSKSTLHGTKPHHAAMARAIGARYLEVTRASSEHPTRTLEEAKRRP